MKIPFDIKYKPQIESGEYKVEMRDGRPARIICWDLHSTFPLAIATEAIYDKNFPSLYYLKENGRRYDSECPNDLFVITPEPELSEFEKAIKDLVLAIDEGELQELGVFEEENLGAWAVKKARELFEMAKDEGKAEALKDLPRWRIWKDGACGNVVGHPIAIIKSYGSYKLTNSLGVGGEKYIMLEDLKKLPGFEEEQK